VVISASRTPERIFESPVTVERLGLQEIKNTASADFYDSLENLKGVDVNTNSLTFKSIHQRNGYAKESLLAILKHLFETKNVHRVVETVDAENTASIHLLKSTGFRMEGHFIENIFFKGKWGSEFQYAMLKREWENRTIH
jgi:L-amino acid N-acyltransferase YncA